MFSLLKKTVIAVAFVITFAVAASPVNYLSPGSEGYAYVNVSSLLRAKPLQQFIPIIEKELQNTGFKVSDFDGELALGINILSNGNKVQCNIDFILGFKNAIAKKIFDRIKAANKNMTVSSVAGKPSLSDKDARIILQTPNTLIIQVHAEGTKPFNTLSTEGKNPLKEVAKQIQQFDLVIFLNVEKLAKKLQPLVTADDKEAAEVMAKIDSACIFAKIVQNDKCYVNLTINCKNAKDAETLAAYIRVLLDTTSRENKDLTPLLSKIKCDVKGDQIICQIFLDKNDIDTFKNLAK